MIARRDLIKWGIVAPALAVEPRAVIAAAPPGLDALLLDDRFPVDSAPVRHVVPVMRFAGDVTRVWYDMLDTRWRDRGFVLGGITGSDALFVLETLANHQGRRVVSRTQLAEPDACGIAPISWVIAPHHPSVTA